MDWCAPAPRSSISMQNLVNLLYRWEQGLRVPDTAADVLLRVIAWQILSESHPARFLLWPAMGPDSRRGTRSQPVPPPQNFAPAEVCEAPGGVITFD